MIEINLKFGCKRAENKLSNEPVHYLAKIYTILLCKIHVPVNSYIKRKL